MVFADDEAFAEADNDYVRETHEAVRAYKNWQPQKPSHKVKAFIDAQETLPHISNRTKLFSKVKLRFLLRIHLCKDNTINIVRSQHPMIIKSFLATTHAAKRNFHHIQKIDMVRWYNNYYSIIFSFYFTYFFKVTHYIYSLVMVVWVSFKCKGVHDVFEYAKCVFDFCIGALVQ